ncbi:PIN domain-containing protein [Mycolicibacter kumamotonensis]|uniref:Ribonuclease VapC n=1 Tax=Mycolicibacter kumamotonensis TaxID=354243 RepID=A0A7K3LJ31_9MYCO|nr:type II toxin-antitoxin system VapC family toxin [Mycolicibacter kumamotonensis]
MILVDTSVWIDHLHDHDAQLASLLEKDQIGCHPLVIEELALGSIKQRNQLLESLSNLRQFPVVSHPELLALVESRRLWGRGLSAVDAALLGAVLITDGAKLWTRDNRLGIAAAEIGVELVHQP